MQITIDTNNLTDLDREVLALALGGDVAPAAPAAKPAAKAAKPAAKPAAKAEPEGPTVDQAVDKATEMVGQGQSKLVKAALASVGASKVSELEPEQVQDFFDALDV